MMGMPLSPAEQAKINEKIAQRKAEVQASLGDKATDKPKEEHHHEDDKHLDDDLLPSEDSVSGEDVLAYITETKELSEKARARVRELRSEIHHLNFQIELEKKKNDALRDALAKMRAQLKEAQVAQADSSASAASESSSQE